MNRCAEARVAEPSEIDDREIASREALLVDEISRQTQRFLERDIDAEAIDRDARIKPEVIEAARAFGLFGLTIPEEYGGLGLSLQGACRIVDQIAQVDRSLAITVGLHAGLGTRGLIEMGGAEARAEWLPQLASGSIVAAFGATEPGAGSDLAAVKTCGRPTQGGLILDGEKSYVTNGGFAGLFTVLVRTPGLGGQRGLSLVLVPREAKGVSVGREEQKLGIRGSSTVSLHLDGVFIPDRYILGTPGRGLAQIGEILAWGRTLMAAGCIGTARAALSTALCHATHRRQFGRPIGEFSSTRAQIADMAAAVYAMESLVRWVGEQSAAGSDIQRSSTCAKVFCSEASFQVCDRALQLHGALGFLEPTGVARLLRDVRVTRIFEGANEVLLVRDGADRISRPDVAGAGIGSASAYSNQKLASIATSFLDHQCQYVLAVDSARTRIGVKIVSHQTILQAFAQAGIALDTAAAALRRANRLDTSRDELLLAEHAAIRLLADVQRHLAGAERAVGDEPREFALSEVIYLAHEGAMKVLNLRGP